MSPKKLLIIDAAGAAISVFLLSFVLVRNQYIFKIPVNILYFLAIFPMLFIIVNIINLRNINENFGFSLKVISFLNIGYCLLSVICIIFLIGTISIFGFLYLLVEVAIVFILAVFEYKLAKELIEKREKENATPSI